ncbi:uncharacterized protein EV420DRAFT_1572616 [Desarmillaria tabescens]|uniref:Uncharacterized protein n=1 Tax=Armillaria tabescens TaxID=1929756 RepID=A0AA39JP98_ARMTA|nr:uncharacterized protein EV420DRAFT_1572616 [Desarmillaria tabescens]KAK0445346.1 hypothetical protein EV420DRAFT_1572616 [Desarmillaria tabescens]
MSSLPEFSLEYRDTMLNVTLMESLAHGIYTTVVVFTLWMIVVHEKCRTRVVMGVVIVVMYLIATLHLALRWCYIRGSFIIHGQTDDTAFDYLFNAPKWMLASSVAFTVNTIIADFVVVWRCWNVWGRNWIVGAIPSLANIVGIVFAGFSLFQQATTPPPGSAWSAAQIDWLLPYFCISVAVTVGCTSLIVFKIWNSHRETDRLTQLPSHRSYKFSRVICTLVESAAMYAVSMIVTLAFYQHGALNANFPISITSTITGLAPTLILARVTIGSTRPLSTYQEPPKSILEFNRTLDPINTLATVPCLDIHDEDSGTSSSSAVTDRDLDSERGWKKTEVEAEVV